MGMLVRLPTEVILKCVKGLELVDCVQLRTTCRLLDKIVTAYLWRHVKIRIHGCRGGSRAGQCTGCCNKLYGYCSNDTRNVMNHESCCEFDEIDEEDEGLELPLQKMPAGLYNDDRWFLEYPLCDKADYNVYLLQVIRRDTFLYVYELHLTIESNNACSRVISHIAKRFKNATLQHNYSLNHLRLELNSTVAVNMLDKLQDLSRRSTDICVNGYFSDLHILCEVPHFANLRENLTMLAFSGLQFGGLTLDQVQILQTLLTRSSNLHSLFLNLVHFTGQSADSPHLATLLTPVEAQLSSFSIYANQIHIQPTRLLLLNRSFPKLTFLQICPVVLDLILDLLGSNLLSLPSLEVLNIAAINHQLCPKDNISEISNAVTRLSKAQSQCPRLQTIVLLTHSFTPVVIPFNSIPYSFRSLNYYVSIPFS